MKRLFIGFAFICMYLGTSVGAFSQPRLSVEREQRLSVLFKQAETLTRGGEVVRAYLTLREADRLEQLWTSNMDGDGTLAAQQLNRFVTRIVRLDDASLMKLLHSKQIRLGDKLSLLHVLEQDVVVNYPGRPGDGLLSGGAGE